MHLTNQSADIVHPTEVRPQNEGLCIVTPKHFLCALFFVLSKHAQFRSIVDLIPVLRECI